MPGIKNCCELEKKINKEHVSKRLGGSLENLGNS